VCKPSESVQEMNSGFLEHAAPLTFCPLQTTAAQ
jgi:hypothetical protein